MNALLIVAALLLIMNTSWVIAVVLVVGVFAFFIGNLIVRQESVLYVPCVMPGMLTPLDNPEGFRSPADRNLEYEDVHLETSDGVRLHAWFIPAEGSEEQRKVAPTVLFCHENAGNIGLRIPHFSKIVKGLEANVFALDYRGYGHSDGTPSEDGLIEDALSAWEWLQAAASRGRIDGKRVFVFGRSLGGAVAVALCQALGQRGDAILPCGVVLENTFLSIFKVVDALFPYIAFDSLKQRFLRLKWETDKRIRDLEVPILFLSGLKDEMVPAWHMEALKKGAEKSPLRRMEAFPEGRHNDTWEKGGEAYWRAQAKFFEECYQFVEMANLKDSIKAEAKKGGDKSVAKACEGTEGGAKI